MYDVVFISYQEPDCNERFEKLQDKFPVIKRVHGVKGIHNAHKQAAEMCSTKMFWIVDGDADLVDDYH